MSSEFLHGCNYPWSADGRTVFYGLDFGANVWGTHLGVSTRRDAVARDFDAMAALGFTAARWFVFCDGRAGIVFDDAGVPAALDAHVFRDMDAALEIARDAGIRLVLVALDHRWMFEGLHESMADPVSGMLLEMRLPHGRADVLGRPRGQDALFGHVLVPLLHRYGPAGARRDLASSIAAWEFMNEPDWAIQEWEADVSVHVASPLPFEVAASLVARFSDAVHVHTSARSTLGGGRVNNLWAWDDETLGIDLLQVHDYPDPRHPEGGDGVLGRPASALRLNRPVLVGEFPSAAAAQYLGFALDAGYCGAWPWSFSGTDAYGRVPSAPLRAFGRAHPELVNARFQP